MSGKKRHHHREPNNIPYSLPTRIGNWLEVWALAEAQRNYRQSMKKRNLLHYNKIKDMLHKTLTPTSLSSDIGVLQYNRVYQIIAPEIFSQDQSSKGLYLSGLITEKEIDKSINLRDGCLVSVSKINLPSSRNSWILQTDDLNNRDIYYGANVLIVLHQSFGEPLYLQAEPNTMDTFKKGLTISLTSMKNSYCYFKILYAHPKDRKYFNGTVVTSSCNVIIHHSASGQNLAVDTTKGIQTFFGPEYLVTCQTFRNSNRIETKENFWQIFGVVGD